MKYIKHYEAIKKRKFEEGDIVKYKFSDSQPFKILSWNKTLRSYRVKDMYRNQISYFGAHLIEIYPLDKLEEFWTKIDTEKYNL